MTYLGIDPGLDGALAVISLTVKNGRTITTRDVFDTPTLVVGRGRSHRRDYQLAEMAKLLQSVSNLSWADHLAVRHQKPGSRCFASTSCHAALEAVHAMPGQGVRSMFMMGRGVGLWEGLLAGLWIPYDRIPPQRWKRRMLDGMGRDKDASRLRAQQLFPAVELSLKRHHGRAEALLLAEYLRRELTGG